MLRNWNWVPWWNWEFHVSSAIVWSNCCHWIPLEDWPRPGRVGMIGLGQLGQAVAWWKSCPTVSTCFLPAPVKTFPLCALEYTMCEKCCWPTPSHTITINHHHHYHHYKYIYIYQKKQEQEQVTRCVLNALHARDEERTGRCNEWPMLTGCSGYWKSPACWFGTCSLWCASMQLRTGSRRRCRLWCLRMFKDVDGLCNMAWASWSNRFRGKWRSLAELLQSVPSSFAKHERERTSV